MSNTNVAVREWQAALIPISVEHAEAKSDDQTPARVDALANAVRSRVEDVFERVNESAGTPGAQWVTKQEVQLIHDVDSEAGSLAGKAYALALGRTEATQSILEQVRGSKHYATLRGFGLSDAHLLQAFVDRGLGNLSLNLGGPGFWELTSEIPKEVKRTRSITTALEEWLGASSNERKVRAAQAAARISPAATNLAPADVLGASAELSAPVILLPWLDDAVTHGHPVASRDKEAATGWLIAMIRTQAELLRCATDPERAKSLGTTADDLLFNLRMFIENVHATVVRAAELVLDLGVNVEGPFGKAMREYVSNLEGFCSAARAQGWTPWPR